MQPDLVWWEKTIEYKFILDAERLIGLKFAAPLSGIQERGGDGIFSADSKIVLIEFKRSSNELDTEHDKFVHYENAATKLTGRDVHHFLVYGSNDNSELRLHACRYFSRDEVSDAIGILKLGLEPSEFKEYLTDLIDLKKEDGRSSGTVTPESMAAVFGVSSRSRTCASISLSEYYRIALPSLYVAHAPTFTDQPSIPRGG